MKLESWVLVVALAAVGCGKAREEAKKGAEQVDAACKDNKAEEAAKLGADFYGKNDVFKSAVDGAAKTWDVKDVSKFNYCGIAFVEVKSRIDN